MISTKHKAGFELSFTLYILRVISYIHSSKIETVISHQGRGGGGTKRTLIFHIMTQTFELNVGRGSVSITHSATPTSIGNFERR